jgi:hypothetical protein
MRANGMELADIELVRVGNLDHFVAIWRSGNGEGVFSSPRDFGSFAIFGADQVVGGRRTQDVELVLAQGAPPPDAPPPDGVASIGDLPDPPPWIELSRNPHLIVDFARLVDGNPLVTLPTAFLPDFLPQKNGSPVIPDTFCGFNIRKADSFVWHTQHNQVINSFPYNEVPNVEALGSQPFLGGIHFVGPMGACLGSNMPWRFFQPLTQTGGDSPVAGLKLVISLSTGSEIEFINNLPPIPEPIEASKLFSDKVFKQLQEIAKSFAFTKIDNGYCSIDNYVQKICENVKSGKAPAGSCPVGDDFFSPC